MKLTPPAAVIAVAAPDNVAAEMRFGDGYVMVSPIWNDSTRSPLDLDGKNTQNVHVHLRDGIDAHCAALLHLGGFGHSHFPY